MTKNYISKTQLYWYDSSEEIFKPISNDGEDEKLFIPKVEIYWYDEKEDAYKPLVTDGKIPLNEDVVDKVTENVKGDIDSLSAQLAEKQQQLDDIWAHKTVLFPSGGDDTAQFKAALNTSKNKELILMPEAIYNISDVLQPLEGTKIRCNGAILKNNTNQKSIFHILNDGVEITDFTIDNPADAVGNPDGIPWFNGAPIFIDGRNKRVKNIKIENVEINNGIPNTSAVTAMGEVENITWKNITINGDKFSSCFHAEWTEGIVAPKNFIIENCTVNNNLSQVQNSCAFWISAGSRIKLVNCRAFNCTRGFTIYTGDLGQQDDHVVSAVLENCHAIDIEKEAIQVWSPYTAYTNKMIVTVKNSHFTGKDVTVTDGARLHHNEGIILFDNCVFENLRRGCYFGSDDTLPVTFTFRNCEFNNIYMQAIYGFNAINSVVEGNIFKNVNIRGGSTATDSVIQLRENSRQNLIRGNVFGDYEGDAKTALYISILSGTVTPTENTITDNLFLKPTTLGVNIGNGSTSENYQIRNYIYNNNAVNNQINGGAVSFMHKGERIVALVSSMPTTGSWRAGDYAQNKSPNILGTTPNKHVIKGWIRVTTGSSNVLGVDWVEDKLTVS